MRFSIIIPVYNVAPYLRGCLDSVCAQTFGDWECICIDDGSTDESLGVLREYAEMDTRFVVIEQTNAGVGAARNRGISCANGSYFCFIDADDFVHPQLLRFYNSAIVSYPDLIMVGVRNFMDGSQVGWNTVTSTPSYKIYDSRKEIRTSHIMRQAAGSVAYKTEKFVRMRFKPYQMGEDFLFLSECLLNASTIAEFGQHLYAYRQRKGSACHSVFGEKKVVDFVQAMTDVLRVMVFGGKKFPPEVLRRMYLNLVETIPFHMRSLGPKKCKGVFSSWKASIRELEHEDFHCPFAMALSRTLASLNCPLFASWLMSLPYLLKTRGLHR